MGDQDADHNFLGFVDLVNGTQTLHLALRTALVAYHASGDGGRLGAIEALRAIVSYFDLVRPFHDERLMLPLLALSTALASLEDNNVAPILRPKPAPGRAKAGTLSSVSQAAAVHTVDRLLGLDMRLLDACKRVAKVLNDCKMRPSRGNGKTYAAQSIRKLRERAKEDVGGFTSLGNSLKLLEQDAGRAAPLDGYSKPEAAKKALEQLKVFLDETRASSFS